MSNDDLFIPANPSLIRGKKYQEALAANSNLNLRDRAGGAPVVIPPPPVAERVEVPPPAQRRNFGPAPFANTSTTRRKD
jgi:hypothetical protein